MRQGAEDLFHWECSAYADINYQPNSPSMDSNTDKMNSGKINYQSSTEFGIFSDQSMPSTDSDNDNNENNLECNLKKLRFNKTMGRKVSESSDTSSLIDSASSISSSLPDNNLTTIQNDNNNTSLNITKFDDIIEKIVELKFTPNNLNDKQNNKLNIDGKINSGDLNDNFEEKDDDIKENVIEKEKILKGKVVVNKIQEEKEYNEEVVENNSDDNDDDDDDLRARGPVKPQPNQSRNKPYYTLNDWLENSAGMQAYTADIDSTAQQILSNQQFSDMINPCLDRLEDYNKRQRHNSLNINSNEWITMANQDGERVPNNLDEGIALIPSIPSITVNENSLSGEAFLMEILDLKGFQGAQLDNSNNTNPSPATSSENWPDSPTSITSYNVLSSRSHSRASSRAQSPGSTANIIGSPPDTTQGIHRVRVSTALSSSSSSNHSFGDTPSPSNYHNSFDGRIEEQLGLQFGNFSTWCESCKSSGTIVNNNENASDDIDNSLKLLEEVIKDDLECEEMQVVPKYISEENSGSALWRYRMRNRILARQQHETNGHNNQVNSSSSSSPKSTSSSSSSSSTSSSSSSSASSNQIQNSNLGNTASIISSAQINLVYPEFNGDYGSSSFQDNISQQNILNRKSLNSAENTLNIEAELVNLLSNNYSHNNIGNNQYYSSEHQQQQQHHHQLHQTTNAMNLPPSSYNNFISQSHETPQQQMHLTKSQPSTSNNQQQFYNCWSAQQQQQQSQQTIFNDFQIPETVSQFRYNHAKRHPERNIAPWSALNLPMTPASNKLKNELDPKEVEKAMKNLLKRSTKELAMPDEDGDTMLMCLLGNPAELYKKKAYLVPLVERLGVINDGLTKINNRGEDALYLAAINCPEMANVTGYLGAVMIQKGIDMSQRLYQTRGDTLIHAVAANGDSHIAVMAELLSLKTQQGNPMFDLSKCNYDGRTPLHIAVEAHDPSGSGINSTGTVRLLLEKGADPKIKEIKCGNTALNLAVSLCCDPALVKSLLMRNGHEAVNIPNRNNNTPLHMAAALSNTIPLDKQVDVCMHLIKAGGLTNIQNQQGKTPLALVSLERKDYIRNIFRKKS
ncbi:hypothetical protein PV325_002829 [Microctonus aethiopoides]|nr:hypothetical protein PV325_002829 [Microctonus aethiopoides]